MHRTSLAGIAAVLAMVAGSTAMAQVGTSFTYQGELKNAGTVVNTSTDIQFSLWTAATGGTQVGSTVTQLAVPVANGLFTREIDFGVNPYVNNQALWLQIAVRNPAGSGSYVPMSARQKLTAAPFSLATRGLNVNSTGQIGVAGRTPQPFLQIDAPTGKYFGTSDGSGGRTLKAAFGLKENESTSCPSFAGMAVYRNPGTNGCGDSDDLLFFTEECNTSCSREVMRIAGNGRVGIGTNAPAFPLDVAGTLRAGFMQTGSLQAATLNADSLELRAPGSTPFLDFSSDTTSDYGARILYDPGTDKLNVFGAASFSVNVLEIRGGSDLVEGFDSQTADLEPGTLMVIDPAHPGQLMPSASAYDTKVAGIVSGAGGVKPGIHMGQNGVMDGKNPIAMTGRVYVKCTSANGAINPGDLLTTSDLPGHAMKASDRAQAPGAVIGKAMSSLDKDTGLVLVLVNLQ